MNSAAENDKSPQRLKIKRLRARSLLVAGFQPRFLWFAMALQPDHPGRFFPRAHLAL
jgi:hypothetical protein